MKEIRLPWIRAPTPIRGEVAPATLLLEAVSSFGGSMELTAVDQLVAYLTADPRSVNQRMRAAGYTEDQVLVAWKNARAAGYTESTRLGQDRLTPAGRTRAAMTGIV